MFGELTKFLSIYSCSSHQHGCLHEVQKHGLKGESKWTARFACRAGKNRGFGVSHDGQQNCKSAVQLKIGLEPGWTYAFVILGQRVCTSLGKYLYISKHSYFLKAITWCYCIKKKQWKSINISETRSTTSLFLIVLTWLQSCNWCLTYLTHEALLIRWLTLAQEVQ